ncbi:MAG: hypothetical protein ACYC5Y_00790 [Symbiobacteriia bacterium]
MTWTWILRGLLVGLAVAALNHWMSLAAVRRTDPKDPFANQGVIVGSYILRLFTSAAVLYALHAHVGAILAALFALTVPHKVFLVFRILNEERREGEK